MPLEVPKLDRRTYREILNEVLARVPVHNPEYTHLNESDPGVTLLQLFSFLGESVLYRANLIPERSKLAFLRLLGVPLRPARAARGLVAFSQPRGPLDPPLVEEESEVLAGEVPFRTTHGLEVLPIEGRVYTKARLDGDRAAELAATYERLFASLEEPGTLLELYETTPFEPPERGLALPSLDFAETVDGVVWLALLARPGDVRGGDPAAARDRVRDAIAGHVLTLGVVPALDDPTVVLSPGGAAAGQAAPGLVVEIPKVDDSAEVPEPRYRRLELAGENDLLRQPGVGEVVLPAASDLRYWDDLGPSLEGTGEFPPSLADTDDGERLLTWLRLRVESSDKSQVGTRLGWVGLNAAHVVQSARVAAELVARGTGEPDQEAVLANTPVLAESLELTVDGEPWRRIDDLAAAAPEVPARRPGMAPGSLAALGRDPAEGPPPEAKVYTLDPEAGAVRFGDGARGARPRRGAVIEATYSWGGGRAGMVGIGAVKKAPNLPAGVKVTNPVPTWGGDEAETRAEAERRVPLFLKDRDRLISEDDFREVTLGTPGVDLGRVEVLPLYHPDLDEGTAVGVVTVLVIPRYDPLHPDAPRPDRLFTETLCRHLEPRRLVTTELRIHGPVYRDLWISIGLEVVPGRAQGPVRQAVEKALRGFLSPLTGGVEGEGWPLRTPVIPNDLAAAAARVDGVQRVDQVLLGDDQGSDGVTSIPLAGLELPRLAALAVQVGEATPLSELRGGIDEAVEEPAGRKPVPVIPEEC